MKIARSGLLMLALCAAVPTAAQDAGQVASAGPSGDIVVNGRRAEETRQRIRSFVEDVSRGTTGRHLARFEQPVCPAAFGLPAEQRTLVARRMRTVATAAGMRLAPDECDPNVLVVVVPDKRAFIEALSRRDPEYFGTLEALQVRRIADQPGHTAAWQLFGPPINARGVQLTVDPTLDLYVNRTTDPATRGRDAARPQFESAIVVVERSALDGLSATQLADYASMRAYASIYAQGEGGFAGDTILNVVDAPPNAEVPVTLTQFDLGYLRGLYRADPTLYTSAQRAAIRDQIGRDVGLSPR